MVGRVTLKSLQGPFDMQMINSQKIFGIGLPRSGTTSLNEALTILGYKSIHNPSKFILKKLAGIYTLNGRWDAITNFGEFFFPILDEIFPNSKFILTIRDKSKWLNSCRIKYKRPSNYFENLNRLSIFGVFVFHQRIFSNIYDQHLHIVFKYFEKRNDLLILNLENDNCWEKLCDFLNQPVPNAPFPHANSTKENQLKREKGRIRRSFSGLVRNITLRAYMGSYFAGFCLFLINNLKKIKGKRY